MVDKELEDYRKQALDLWFKDGSCTGGNAEQIQDAENEDDEFKRIEQEQRLKDQTKPA